MNVQLGQWNAPRVYQVTHAMPRATGVAAYAAVLLLGATSKALSFQLPQHGGRSRGAAWLAAGDGQDDTGKRPTEILVCNEGMCKDEGACRLREALESGGSGCVEYTSCLGTW